MLYRRQVPHISCSAGRENLPPPPSKRTIVGQTAHQYQSQWSPAPNSSLHTGPQGKAGGRVMLQATQTSLPQPPQDRNTKASVSKVQRYHVVQFSLFLSHAHSAVGQKMSYSSPIGMATAHVHVSHEGKWSL